jgi:hypothetical protein
LPAWYGGEVTIRATLLSGSSVIVSAEWHQIWSTSVASLTVLSLENSAGANPRA